jgi:hypothetical protein
MSDSSDEEIPTKGSAYRIDSGDLSIQEKLESLEHICSDEEAQHLDDDLAAEESGVIGDEVQLSLSEGDDVEVDDEEPDVLQLEVHQIKRASHVSSEILIHLPASAKAHRRRSRMVDQNLLNAINGNIPTPSSPVDEPPVPSTPDFAASNSQISLDSKSCTNDVILEASNEYGCPTILESEVGRDKEDFNDAGKKFGEHFMKDSLDFITKPEKRKSAFVKNPILGVEEFDLDNPTTPELSIPGTVFIEDSSGKSRLAFNIKIVSSFGCVYRPRRVSEIRAFDKECRQLFPDVELEKLPQKLTFGLNRNQKVVEIRRVKLEHYLRMACQLIELRAHLIQFLSIEATALFEVGDHYKRHPPESVLESSQDIDKVTLPFSASIGTTKSSLSSKKKSRSLFSKKPPPLAVAADISPPSPNGPSPVMTKRTTPSTKDPNNRRKSNILPQVVAENVHKSMLEPKRVPVMSPAAHEKQHRRTSA